jgi:hypothetical protein
MIDELQRCINSMFATKEVSTEHNNVYMNIRERADKGLFSLAPPVMMHVRKKEDSKTSRQCLSWNVDFYELAK